MRLKIFTTWIFFILSSVSWSLSAQTDHQNHQTSYQTGLLTDMIDTSTSMGRSMLSLYSRYGNINFSSYVQFQYQYASEKGIASFNGGDFSANSDNRFRMRRARLRSDYSYYTPEGKISTYFLFQIDATDRGVNVRDCWGRFYENKLELFHLTAGIFSRPFGYELLYSSSKRESLERGRMSQILMNTERDMGASISFENRRKNAKFKLLTAELGVFNGQGLTANNEFDNHKDIIGRIALKKTSLTKDKKVQLSGGISTLYGGISNLASRYGTMENGQMTLGDSAATNLGKVLPRHYYGADAQLHIKNKVGESEFRAEYISGIQTATLASTSTPGSYPTSGTTIQPFYLRQFNGAYFYYLQHLGSLKHQLVVKYDWYDPNRKIKGNQVDPAKGNTAADIKYSTLGVGYVFYANPHLKWTLYFDHPMNEKTAIAGYEKDLSDNTLSLRAQFSF